MPTGRSQTSTRRSSFHHDSFAYEILRTAAFLRRSYMDVFDQREITYQQYNVLRILRGAGPTGLPTWKSSSDDRPDSRYHAPARPAGRKSLILCERPARNRRTVVCYATKKGLALLRKWVPSYTAVSVTCRTVVLRQAQLKRIAGIFGASWNSLVIVTKMS